MSGFEIAGAVLGSLPIVVGALELYIGGVGTLQKWRFFRRELKSLLRTIETEEIKLKNIFEKLLWGIAQPTKIEEMLDKPFGPLWKDPDIYGKVRCRLWRNYEVFESTVTDIRDAVEEIKRKLGIKSDGRIPWAESPNLKREIKSASFILQRSDYQDIVSRIRDGVTNLERLLDIDIEMEANRRQLSNTRLYNLIQKLSSGVYHALRSAVVCSCPDLHEVGLRLTVPRPSTSTARDDDRDIVKELVFYIAMSYSSGMVEVNSDALIGNPARRWGELVVKPEVTVLENKPTSRVQHQSPIPLTSSGGKRRTVRFSFAAETRHTASSFTNSTTGSTSTGSGTPTLTASCLGALSLTATNDIRDICQTVRGLSEQNAGQCCGYITDMSTNKEAQKYGVYPHNGQSNSEYWTTISLGEALADTNGASPPLLYGDRLRLAWTVASSVLQLHGTPWISAMPTLDEVFLRVVQRNGRPIYRDAFVIKRLPEPQPIITPPPTEKNATPFALGILLIELILGKRIDTFRQPNDRSHDHQARHLNDYETAMKLLDKVNTIGGANYSSAVRRCIGCKSYFQPNANQNEEVLHVRTEVLMGIVGLLANDIMNSGESFTS